MRNNKANRMITKKKEQGKIKNERTNRGGREDIGWDKEGTDKEKKTN